MEFILQRGYCTKSVGWESCIKSSVRELCLPNYFISGLVYQTEGFDNLRTRKFDVNKKREKSKTEGKDGNCDKKISHISYKLPLMFFIFSLTLSWRRPISYRNQSIDLRSKSMDWFLYDIGLRHERVNSVILIMSKKRCQSKRLTWHTLTLRLYLDYIMIIFTIQSFWNSLR